MIEATEQASSATALVSAVREGITCSREPAHFYGLVRGLDIALSTLKDSHADLRAAIRELRERAAGLTSVDTYHGGVATGLELASELTMWWLIVTRTNTPSVLTVNEGHRMK